MGSLTDRSDQSGGSGATNEGDGADRADDAANSAVPVREAEHPDSHIHGDRGAIDAPSLIGGGKGVSIERTLSYESPLPPPEAMRDYEAIQPGAFDRILKLTEQQQTHRINEEEREGTHRRAVVRRDQAAGIADQKRGMYLGTLVLGLVILGVSRARRSISRGRRPSLPPARPGSSRSSAGANGAAMRASRAGRRTHSSRVSGPETNPVAIRAIATGL
jgi:hypothetical protein